MSKNMMEEEEFFMEDCLERDGSPPLGMSHVDEEAGSDDEVETRSHAHAGRLSPLCSVTARSRMPASSRHPLRKGRSESSDEDVFINNSHLGDDHLATRPLMYPRKRLNSPRQHAKLTFVSGGKPCQCLLQYIYPVIYIGIMFALLGALAYFVVYFMNNIIDQWLHTDYKSESPTEKVIGCTHLAVEEVWVKGIPKLMTESAFRLLDINGDGVLDILFGFATGAEGYAVPALVCDIYFNGSHPCLGGLLALDGRTGHELWRHYSPHEVYALNCNEDLDGDDVKDCLIAGRVGTFEAISCREGHMLWNFTHATRNDVMNVYTGQYVPDLNGDGVPDIINIHGGDPFGEPGSSTRLAGKIYLFSGRSGQVLQWVTVPDGRESYFSPVLYKRADGTDVVVFGTGGETHPGSLWYIALSDLRKGIINRARTIVSNPFKGFMTPPVLVDLTKDGVEDIVFANYNSTVMAFDGETYQALWNFSYTSSETYASPAPGYFNDDDVPDFIIHWQYGPGFPVYYHSITTIVDGRNGEQLLKPYIRSSMGAQSSPLSISVEGYGNDIFLFWHADCLGHEGEGGQFSFVEGTNVHEQSRSDFCRLRFKTEGVSRMYALSRHGVPPGTAVYNSEERKEVESSAWVNTTAEAQDFLQRHPTYQANYRQWREWVQHNLDQMKEHDLDHSIEEEPDLSSKYDSTDLNRLLSEISPDADWGYLSHLPTNDDNQDDLARDPYLESHYAKKSGRLWDDVHEYPSDRLETDKTRLGHDGWNLPIDDTEMSGRTWKELSDALSGRAGDTYQPRGRKRRSDRHMQPMEKTQKHRTTYNIPESVVKSKRFRRGKRSLYKRQPQGTSGHSAPGFVGHRGRRHVGPHDEEGLQRLISTGTVAPSLLDPSSPDAPHSMDVVFATYWFYPAKTEALLPEDQACIDRKMALQTIRFDPKSKYYGMDDDGYGHAVTKECLEESEHQLPDQGTYNNQHTFNPYNLHMGQLTVYRLRIKCTCGANRKQKSGTERCSRMLPFDKQQWTSYMGSEGTSHWRPRDGATPMNR